MKNKIIIMLTIIAGMFSFTSCLNDTADNWKVDVAGKMYLTVMKPQLQSMGLKPKVDTVSYSFLINVATDALPTKDITITLKVDSAAVAEYNISKGYKQDSTAAFKLYPHIKILNPTIVITKGTRTATVNVEVWGAETLNACDKFISAVTIATASDNVPIATNMKSYLLSLPISNPYEGTYHSTGTFTHPVNGPRAIDEVKTLSTVDCQSVKTTIGDLGDEGDYFVVYKVNDDNSVTISGSQSATQPLIQEGVNSYNPATHTFTVNYYYAGSGGNRKISETLVRN